MPESKEAVIANIKAAVVAGDFHRKVEVNDPVVSPEQLQQDLAHYLHTRHTWPFKTKSIIAQSAANLASPIINHHNEIIGLDKIQALHTPGVITSNHFHPMENSTLRLAILRAGYKKMGIVSQVTNFDMTGFLGFFMRYSNTIPIANTIRYMGTTFPKLLTEQFDAGNPILMYPEQEMWFNYRKPRPVQRGAYFYAATFNVPILSFFNEIITLPKPDKSMLNFNQVRYRLHVLDPIFPDPTLSVKTNSVAMMGQDYTQKKAAYEAAYQQPLTYDFSPADIAGWNGH